MKKQRFKVPYELRQIGIEAEAYEKLRDRYVKVPFGFKKAKKCAIKTEELWSKFWIGIRVLYPKSRSEKVIWTSMGEFVEIMEEEKEDR